MFAFVCAVTALGCALVALWICAAPMLGAAGALLVESAVLCAVGFAAFVLARRAREARSPVAVPGPAPGIADGTLLERGSRFVRQHTGFALVAALLAGALLAGET